MRRQTPGVLHFDELLEDRIARAEREDPARVIAKLEPMVLERRRERLKEVIARRLASVAVVLDAPYDPHNGAAIVRSCEAFGVQALHVVEMRGYPFVVAGSVARGTQKWIDVTKWPSGEDVAAHLRAGGFELIAAAADGELQPSELRAIPRVAIVLGNERDGVREELTRACARRVRVPMRGFAESLNVSVTGAILLAAATEGRAGDLDEASRLRLYARGIFLSVPRAGEHLL